MAVDSIRFVRWARSGTVFRDEVSLRVASRRLGASLPAHRE